MLKFSHGWSWKRLQNWKNERLKKSLMSLLLSPFIIHSFVIYHMKNLNSSLNIKYKPITKQV
jgi:hypothetical protein